MNIHSQQSNGIKVFLLSMLVSIFGICLLSNFAYFSSSIHVFKRDTYQLFKYSKIPFIIKNGKQM